VTDRDLQTSALLSWSRDGGALRPDRSKAILEGLLTLPAPKTPTASRVSWLRWALSGGALAAIVALAVVGGPAADRAASPTDCAVPTPPVALLRAQVARSDDLAERMRDYRQDVFGALAGCAGSTEPSVSGWLAMADEASARADEALAAGRLDDARRAIRAIVEIPAPGNVAQDDARLIVRDAAGRLAEIELLAGRPADALAWTDRGLAGGAEHDVFSVALLVSRGRAKEALGRELEAVDDYVQAQRIDEALLERALEE